MDPNKIRNIVLVDLFYNTTFDALKYINTICPKANQLLSNLVSWHTTTYHQSLHNNLGQIITPQSLNSLVQINQN
jgi:hypothetical protein